MKLCHKKLNINQSVRRIVKVLQRQAKKTGAEPPPISAMNKSLVFLCCFTTGPVWPRARGLSDTMSHRAFMWRVANTRGAIARVFLFFFSCLSLNYSYFTIGGVHITIWWWWAIIIPVDKLAAFVPHGDCNTSIHGPVRKAGIPSWDGDRSHCVARTSSNTWAVQYNHASTCALFQARGSGTVDPGRRF